MVFTNSSLLYYFRNKLNLPNKNNIKLKCFKGSYKKKVLTLNTKVVGETINSKIKRLIQILKKDGSDHIFVSAPENVAWLLNIRGRDNPYSPIPNCRIILDTKGHVNFFSDIKKSSNILKKKKFYENIFFQ